MFYTESICVSSIASNAFHFQRCPFEGSQPRTQSCHGHCFSFESIAPSCADTILAFFIGLGPSTYLVVDQTYKSAQ